MFSLSTGVLLTLALSADIARAAEPPRASECAVAPRIELTAESIEQATGVCVNADEPTTFVFGVPLPSEAVVLSDNRSVDFAQGEAFVTVYPKRSFLPGERVMLTVRFGDRAAPENASFWLVGHATQGARRVEVFRHALSADALKKEASEARAEARQCQEEKTRLLAERTEPGGLMGAAWLERTGEIHSEDILEGLTQYPDNALTVKAANVYRHSGSVAVRLQLVNLGTDPWTASWATLKDTKGAKVDFFVWQEASITPGARGFLIMSPQRFQKKISCPCSLQAGDTQASRTITLGNVAFLLSSDTAER